MPKPGGKGNIAPIVIKRIEEGEHAHHGGAWKIAYADFVTAMMAFFLLMWLLGSTTEGDKKGLADFFGSPLKVALGGLLEQKVDDGSKELQCIKTTLLASMQGYAPQVAVEFGRKVLFSTDRPTFVELESHVKGKK